MLVSLFHAGGITAVGERIECLKAVVCMNLVEHRVRMFGNHCYHKLRVPVEVTAVIGILQKPVDRLQVGYIFQWDML